MSDKDDDIGFYLSMGALITLALWIVRKPSRILTVFLIVVICASWTAIHEAKEKEIRTAKYNQSHIDPKQKEAHRAANERFNWYQQARIIATWENYLGTLPSVTSSKYWLEGMVNGKPFIQNENGRYLGRELNHAEISKFIKKVIPELLDDKHFVEYTNPYGIGITSFSNKESILEFLHIDKSSDGLYIWYGSLYGENAYKWLNPTSFIPTPDPECDYRQWHDKIETAYNGYKNAVRSIRIRIYEEENLKPLVLKTKKSILNNKPRIKSKELEILLQAKVLEDYYYLSILKTYPDYQLPESLISI